MPPRRLAVLAPAVLLLAACTTARMHVPEVQLRLTAAAFAPGGVVPLVATLRNETGDTLAMEFATACWLEFHVRAPDGRGLHASRAEESCGERATRIVLAPGAERRAQARWASSPADTAPVTAYLILEEHHLERRGERVFKAGHRFGETRLRPRADAVSPSEDRP